jgi:hypothetical protein
MNDGTPLALHLKVREGVLQTYNGASPVDITACGWVNPPTERLVYKVDEVTCVVCLERLQNKKTPTH